VLEIGCGTGNLALLVKRMRPQLEVVGLDPDAKALQRARRKARRVELSLELDTGFADALPYPDGSFDGVLSSLISTTSRRTSGSRRCGRSCACCGRAARCTTDNLPEPFRQILTAHAERCAGLIDTIKARLGDN
jgi:SAM-dependent methyltransferase